MIIHRYIPFEPEDKEKWSAEELASFLSELILRYDIQVEEALKEILHRGLPVNLFLKSAGLEELIGEFLENLDKQKEDILNRYDIRPAIGETENDLKANYGILKALLKEYPEFQETLEQSLQNLSYDRIQQLRWNILQRQELNTKEIHNQLNRLRADMEDLNSLIEGSKKYLFRGKEELNRSSALRILKHLEEIEKLKENLKNAIRNGDIYNFDLDKIARILGPESYEEFLKRREEIFKNITKLLEDRGMIIKNENGQYDLSPDSIRRIGRKSLEEIFKHLKPDMTGGSLYTKEEGEGEQVLPSTRPFETGDSFTGVDITNSVLNALIRTGSPKPLLQDLEVFRSRGMAKSSTVILLDMSGSMMRVDRFYYAKKMILALESLIREEFREDTLYIVGFGTFAKTYTIAQVPRLQPYPVTLFDPYIRLRFDLSKRKHGDFRGIPEYFTNLQKGLALSRRLLGSGQTKNKQIILITDGVPTAHFEGTVLHINYPPSPADFDFALKEAIACREDGITINTFLLTNEWNFHFFEGRSFIHDFAKTTRGRIFYPHPSELTKFVLADFIEEKKKLIS